MQDKPDVGAMVDAVLVRTHIMLADIEPVAPDALVGAETLLEPCAGGETSRHDPPTVGEVGGDAFKHGAIGWGGVVAFREVLEVFLILRVLFGNVLHHSTPEYAVTMGCKEVHKVFLGVDAVWRENDPLIGRAAKYNGNMFELACFDKFRWIVAENGVVHIQTWAVCRISVCCFEFRYCEATETFNVGAAGGVEDGLILRF